MCVCVSLFASEAIIFVNHWIVLNDAKVQCFRRVLARKDAQVVRNSTFDHRECLCLACQCWSAMTASTHQATGSRQNRTGDTKFPRSQALLKLKVVAAKELFKDSLVWHYANCVRGI